jgi:hypothetical protein
MVISQSRLAAIWDCRPKLEQLGEHPPQKGGWFFTENHHIKQKKTILKVCLKRIH